MTSYLEGATVYHLLARWDHVEDEAESWCGEEGQPVEADPDHDELCRRCLEASPLHVVEDDEEEAEDDE
jgi:hypothetical protein